MDGFNKTIWINWFQGWDNAPEICGHCLTSWKYHNPEWEVVKLDSTNISEYCELPKVKTNLANYSDLLRVVLMYKYGGVWADSTLFCNKPLDSWIDDDTDSFIFTRSDNDVTNKIICNWFVYANKDSHLINELYNRTIEYWEKNPVQEELNYWMHDLIKDMYLNDPKSKSIMDSWSHIDCSTVPSGKGAHLFTPYEHYPHQPINEEAKNRIDSQVEPVYKLTHKIDTKWNNPGTIFTHLFDTVS